MVKMILKSVFCFVMSAMACIGIGSMSSENWMVTVPMTFISMFLFGCAAYNGWLDDVIEFVDYNEQKMFG
jgi:hypothetical protein